MRAIEWAKRTLVKRPCYALNSGSNNPGAAVVIYPSNNGASFARCHAASPN
ncbi:hypothetical protein GCM10022269_12570 [Sphingorhabdus rigui]